MDFFQNESGFLWKKFTVVSLLLTLLPQNGYIHPDEFFQSVEVVAGDTFGYEVNRPWEFDSRFPIRSIVLPYLSCGPVYKLLKALSNTELLKDYTIVSPYTLLVLPRLVFFAASVLCSIYLGRLGEKIGFTKKSVQCCFASSHVVLVFFTRTFSNTTESFLFIYLLHICTRYSGEKGVRGTFPIVLTIVAGVFNRPTFIFFALVPYLYWLFSIDVREKAQCRFRASLPQLLLKMGLSFMYGYVLSVFFVICDTMYFKGFTLTEILEKLENAQSVTGLLFDNLAITPLNFLIYNMDSKNLAEHGLHPRMTHILVNAPLMFGILAPYAYYETVMNMKRLLWGTAVPARVYLLCCFLVPLLFLSIFPHQEPRFLIPLIAPLALLYAFKLYGPKSSGFLHIAWTTSTCLSVVFFSLLHQGGVVPAIEYLNHQLGTGQLPVNTTIQNHVVFYHTYMPPQFMFQVRNSMTHVHDLKGSSVHTLSLFLKQLDLEQTGTVAPSVWLVMPRPLQFILEKVERDTDLKIIPEKGLFPHLSTEDPPRAHVIMNVSKRLCANASSAVYELLCTQKTFIISYLNSLTLDIYKVNAKAITRLKGVSSMSANMM